LAGHDSGEERFIASDDVTGHLQRIVGDCDLIVGTEEELHIVGGREDTIEAIGRIRELGTAVVVCKRGPMGCSVFPGDIPDTLDEGLTGPGYPVEVYNVLGAGDSFMSGFLRGWLRGEPLETCCSWANACGAFAVSRLLCSPEIPTWTELQEFLEKGSSETALRKDAQLNHVHWATTRRPQADTLMALAVDHRSQFEEMAEAADAPLERIAGFKRLAVQAACRTADGNPGYGVLLDARYGTRALHEATGAGLWIGRPVERPGSRPLQFEEAVDLGGYLTEWPVAHTVKCLCFYHPDDPDDLRAGQDAALLRLYDACRTIGRELLVEIVAGQHGRLGQDTVARVMSHLYGLGIRPDWWKLEAQPSAAAWSAIESVVLDNDPFCRGIVVLGQGADEGSLGEAFVLAAQTPLVRGFAVGRTIFAETARLWLAGEIGDEQAISDVAAGFGRLAELWRRAIASRAA
jgi:5-dehydro-2-deoxygluconokinase